jgi:Rrf2 family transcriptional regulator, iron-sulfur cluster assembly transcription factor
MRLELTRRGDYAVRAMLALARNPDDDPVSVHRIAAAMAIPVQVLPRVMTDLHRAGLVEAVAGRTGGYRLARAADRISLLAVVEAIEGDSRRTTCVLRGGPCGRDGQCDVHAVFSAAQAAMLTSLADASLATLSTPRDGPTERVEERRGAKAERRHGGADGQRQADLGEGVALEA